MTSAFPLPIDGNGPLERADAGIEEGDAHSRRRMSRAVVARKGGEDIAPVKIPTDGVSISDPNSLTRKTRSNAFCVGGGLEFNAPTPPRIASTIDDRTRGLFNILNIFFLPHLGSQPPRNRRYCLTSISLYLRARKPPVTNTARPAFVTARNSGLVACGSNTHSVAP